MPESRLPLALLPGLLCDHALWSAQVKGLSDIAESRVADFTTQDSVEEMARSVLAMMPEGRFALAGLSMGGYVALEVMRQAPEQIERFALLDTTARPDTDEQKRRRRGLLSLADKGQFKGVTPRLLPLLLSKRFLEVEAVTSVVMAMAERVGKEAFKGQQRAIMNRPDSRPLLPGIKVPTLILCGAEDALTPPDRHKEMAEAIPGADLVILGGAGHLAPLERPDAVTRALRAWLRR